MTMNITKRAILFGGKAIVSVLDTTDLVNEAIQLHNFSVPVAKAIGKLLTITAFMSGNFKGLSNKLTLIVQGDGQIGKMVSCGNYGGKVRCYCENPKAGIAAQNITVEQIVGKKGNLTVIKDFGMKKPYNGMIQLAKGDIDSDFSYYFTVSEQLSTVISTGVEIDGGKCVRSGGIVIQPMPNCDDHFITILEDIVTNFKDFCLIMQQKSVEEILDFYFGHFEIKILDDIYPDYECTCSQERIENMILTLGKTEALKICEEQKNIEVLCEFCNKKYVFNSGDIIKLFDK